MEGFKNSLNTEHVLEEEGLGPIVGYVTPTATQYATGLPGGLLSKVTELTRRTYHSKLTSRASFIP